MTSDPKEISSPTEGWLKEMPPKSGDIGQECRKRDNKKGISRKDGLLTEYVREEQGFNEL